jgi:hypothetical protein
MREDTATPHNQQCTCTPVYICGDDFTHPQIAPILSWYSIDNYRAGAALAFAVTGLLGTCQTQIVPQQVEKDPVRLDNKLTWSPIHLHHDFLHALHPPFGIYYAIM